VLDKKNRGRAFLLGDLNHSWLGGAIAIGIAYFLAARLGLALTSHAGLAFFWPAAGIATGALIVFGPAARLPVAVGVAFASIVSSLTVGRSPLLAFTLVVSNAGQVLLTAWLVERWFGGVLKLDDVRQVLGFLAASAIAVAIGAGWAAVAISLVEPTVFPLQVWRVWFSAGLLGIVTVAPLLIGLGEAVRNMPPRRELVEGVTALVILTALSAFLISMPQGPWVTALPVALVFPLLLWIAVRCQPVFAAAAMFVLTLAIVWSATLKVGHFGDASIPLADRILAAQTLVLAATLLALVLAALFCERRRSEAKLKQSNKRLQLALDCAELGTWSLHLNSGCFENDVRDREIHGHGQPPQTLAEMRSQVHPDDLSKLDAAFTTLGRAGGNCRTEYRLAPCTDQERAGRERWVAMEGTVVRRANGRPEQLLGVTRDITERKHAEDALHQREVELGEAQRLAHIGSWYWEAEADTLVASDELLRIFGLDPATQHVLTLRDQRGRWHPVDDWERLNAAVRRTMQTGLGYELELRAFRNEVPIWITARGAAVHNSNGQIVGLRGTVQDITERKQAELALADQNLQLRLAEMAGLIGSYAYDAFTEIGQISSGYAAIHGLPEGTTEITRSEWLARVHPEDVQRLQLCRSEALREQREEYKVDYRIVRHDGEVRWIESRVFIMYGSDATGYRLTGVNIDVTERKRAEQALVERNILLALAGRAARVGTFAYDTDKEILQISEDYAVIHGLPEGTAKIARREWLAGVHPQDVERVELPRSEAFREQRNEYSAEFRIIRPGGEVRWVEIRCFITYDGDGHPKRVVGVSTDVTDRKQAELRLAERNAQFGLAQKATRVGTYTYDNIARTMQLTEASAAILGLPQGTTEITADDWRLRVHPDDMQRLAAERRHAFKERQPELVGELRIIRPTGEVRWIEARALITYGADGSPCSMIGVYIDVTERKRAEEGRKFLNAELDHRVKNTLATVTAVISHTRQGSRSVAEFAAALEGRIRSMAATHELLSARRWSGISLAKLIRRELAPYANNNNNKISGPDVALRPEAAQAMAMVIHELTTNAAKHGALSTKKGRVSIRWDRRLNGRPRPDLALEWQEIGGPPASAPATSGYGTSTICDLIPYEFGGTVDLVFAPEGVRCRLKLPAEWLSDGGDPGSGVIADMPQSKA
jgi:PAS domain S-box-containing protein